MTLKERNDAAKKKIKDTLDAKPELRDALALWAMMALMYDGGFHPIGPHDDIDGGDLVELLASIAATHGVSNETFHVR